MRLVTGATGLVGGHLLYRFRESATSTIAIYRSKESIEKTREIFRSYDSAHDLLVDKFLWKKADILNIPSIEDVIEGVKEVYHCAALIDAPSFDMMKQVNVQGTENIINCALEYGVQKFCYVSSIAALGDSIGNLAVSEEDFFNLDGYNSDYAVTKYAAEMEVWRSTQEGLRVIIVNPGVILGEGDFENGSGRLFDKTYKGNKFYTSGSSGFVDVKDVVSIMLKLMKSEIHNERFILVSENRSYKNILYLIAQNLKVSGPRYKITQPLLYIWSVLSYLFNVLSSKKVFKKADVLTLTTQTSYSNEKVKSALNFEFVKMDQTIERVSKFFLSARA